MIKNYLLLSLKVLRRKPFYTFISLFGISFTLMILMLITSMGDAVFGANAPMSDVDRMVFVPMVEQFKIQYDTTYTVDTIFMDNGAMRYDSVMNTKEVGKSMNNGYMSYALGDKHLRHLEAAEKTSLFGPDHEIDGYLDGRKVNFSASYTDPAYWDIFDFNFLHGQHYGPEDYEQGSKVAIIREDAAREYFGVADATVLGQEVEVGRDRFRVIGVVAQPLKDDDFIGGDLFMPTTAGGSRIMGAPGDIRGGFAMAFVAKSSAERAALMRELDFVAKNFTLPADSYFNELKIYNGTAVQNFARNTIGGEDMSDSVLYLFIPIGILLALFIILPLLNLVNLNTSRVYERQSEIAVRKAFGADSRNILYQFILENLVLTAIGGVIGLVLAYGVVQYINANDLLGWVRLSFSPTVFFYAILIIFIFGLLSGLLPAYRMSRTNIAGSLR